MVSTHSDNPAVHLSKIEFAWGSSEHDFVINITDLRLEKGESVLLVGRSGTGKSTLLSLLCGILQPQKGNIQILGESMGKMPSPLKDSFRADHIGIIFQQFNLIPYLSAIDNVLLPLYFSPARRKISGDSQSNITAEAKRLLDSLGITSQTLGLQKAVALSIGQQQRVAAARAFIGSPELIIADEPTSSLDEANQTDFLNQLFSQVHETGASLLVVSHNPNIAKRFDRLIELDQILDINAKKGSIG